MSTALMALWPWLIALAVICGGLWWAHRPLDDDYHVEYGQLWPAIDITPPPHADATNEELDAWVAEALFMANTPAAFDRAAAQIRALPEVAS